MGRLLACIIALWAAPSFAAAHCTAMFGDWHVKKGDVADVAVSATPDGKQDVRFRFTGSQMTQLTQRYLNKPLPMRIGTFKTDPVVRGVIAGHDGVIPSVTKKDADMIIQELGYCI